MGPIGVLQPIPVPNIPFEVISMDFIRQLPMTKEYHGYCVPWVPANRYPSDAGTCLCNTHGYYYRVRHLRGYDRYYPGKQCILPGYPPIIPAGENTCGSG